MPNAPEQLQILAPNLHLTLVGLVLLLVILFLRDGLAPRLAAVVPRRREAPTA